MTNLPVPNPNDIALSGEQVASCFLGGLIDPNDLSEGPFKLYTDMRTYQACVFNKDKTGFPGGFGVYEDIYPLTNDGHITLCLWPWMPVRDTPGGYIDVFDPHPILKLTWMIERLVLRGIPQSEHAKFPWTLKQLEIELKSTHIHSKSLDYAVKILMRAREIWPPI